MSRSSRNSSPSESRSVRRVWRFGDGVFDEANWRLTVAGQPVDLEIKPLELLLEFLRRPGEALTKDELIEAVWPDTLVVEASLPTAISKLRRALRDDAQQIIVTLPRIGYRLAAPVTMSLADPGPALGGPALTEGDPAPGRPQWRLTRTLGSTPANAVWLATHDKTDEVRVFKFANAPAYLRQLKQEATVSRLLQKTLGARPDFVPVLEWNFDKPPFFLESDYGGENLHGWAQAQGGLDGVSLAVRLKIAADICTTVAAAHSVGVLHRDLKPSNILAAAQANGGPQIRIVDFGNAGLTDPGQLLALQITDPGLAEDEASTSQGRGGSALYVAPEVLQTGQASVASDVYALGVILYQLVIGDLTRPLSPGWDGEIADPLLRDDIAAAAHGDTVRRLGSAADLADRLTRLDARRADLKAATEQQALAEAAATALARARMRRPWVIAAGVALAVGTAVSTGLYLEARHDRDTARRQGAIAEATSQFLATDLLARSNPFKSGSADESLTSAIAEAAPGIDRRFAGEPAVAARLHQAIARAFDRRSDWASARREYQTAEALWLKAEGASSQDAITTGLQRAMMEARSYEKGSLPAARAKLADQEAKLKSIDKPRPEIAVWLASARGIVALVSDDIPNAASQFETAAKLSQDLPTFDPTERLTFQQRQAFALIRLGDGAKAERLFRQLALGYAAIEGPDGPNVLLVRMNLAQALMIEKRYEESVKEGSAVLPLLEAKLGPDHEMTLQALATRTQSEGELEHWDEAIADGTRVHEAAVRKQGPGSFFAIASLSDTANAQCRAGRLAEGVVNAEKAWRASATAFGPTALTQAAAFQFAACLINAGRFDAAEERLRGIDPKAVIPLVGDPDWAANLELARAQIAYAKHDYEAANQHAAAAAAVYEKAGADTYQARVLARLKGALRKV